MSIKENIGNRFINKVAIRFHMQNIDKNNKTLTLAKKRFEQALQNSTSATQDKVKAIINSFKKAPKSNFEWINFYCHTRLLLLSNDCQKILDEKIATIEKTELKEITQALTVNQKSINWKRTLFTSTQYSLLLVLTVWLWPQSKVNTSTAYATTIDNMSYDYSLGRDSEPDLSAQLLLKANSAKPLREEPYFLAHNSDDLDSSLVQQEQPRIERWLKKIRSDSKRSDIYNNSNIKRKTLTLGVIESILNPSEVSPSGAIGAFQIMPGLEGVYGSPEVLRDTIAENSACLPTFEKKQNRTVRTYKRLVNNQQHIDLLKFLKKEKIKRSSFWNQFAKQQRQIYTDIECSHWLASKYMENIEKTINYLPERQVEYFSVMAYNMGLENSKRLISAMKSEGLYIDPVTIINYISDKQFDKKISKMISKRLPHYSKRSQYKEVRRTVVRMKEARTYLARYLATKRVIQEQFNNPARYALAEKSSTNLEQTL